MAHWWFGFPWASCVGNPTLTQIQTGKKNKCVDQWKKAKDTRCSSAMTAAVTRLRKQLIFLIFISYSGPSSRPQREIITSSLLNMHVINYASCYHRLICIGLSCIKVPLITIHKTISQVYRVNIQHPAPDQKIHTKTKKKLIYKTGGTHPVAYSNRPTHMFKQLQTQPCLLKCIDSQKRTCVHRDTLSGHPLRTRHIMQPHWQKVQVSLIRVTVRSVPTH